MFEIFFLGLVFGFGGGMMVYVARCIWIEEIKVAGWDFWTGSAFCLMLFFAFCLFSASATLLFLWGG